MSSKKVDLKTTNKKNGGSKKSDNKKKSHNKKKNLKGGSSDIALPTLTTLDWHKENQYPIPYAADTSVGINEYQFGRTTPNNKFIVASGLVLGKDGLEMTAPDMTGFNNLGLGKGPMGVLPEGISSCGIVGKNMKGGSKLKKRKDDSKKKTSKSKPKAKKSILKVIENDVVGFGSAVGKTVKGLFTSKDSKKTKKTKKEVKSKKTKTSKKDTKKIKKVIKK